MVEGRLRPYRVAGGGRVRARAGDRPEPGCHGQLPYVCLCWFVAAATDFARSGCASSYARCPRIRARWSCPRPLDCCPFAGCQERKEARSAHRRSSRFPARARLVRRCPAARRHEGKNPGCPSPRAQEQSRGGYCPSGRGPPARGRSVRSWLGVRRPPGTSSHRSQQPSDSPCRRLSFFSALLYCSHHRMLPPVLHLPLPAEPAPFSVRHLRAPRTRLPRLALAWFDGDEVYRVRRGEASVHLLLLVPV